MDKIFEQIRAGKVQEIVVLGAPASLAPELSRLPVLTIHHHYASARRAGIWLVFVASKSELETIAAEIAARASEDAILWLAYPSAAKDSNASDLDDLNDETCRQALLSIGFQCTEKLQLLPQWTTLRFERVGSAEIQRELSGNAADNIPCKTPLEGLPTIESNHPKPGGNNETNARKTTPRAGRSSQNSPRPGPVRDPKARPARSGGRRTGAARTGAGSDAGKQ